MCIRDSCSNGERRSLRCCISHKRTDKTGKRRAIFNLARLLLYHLIDSVSYTHLDVYKRQTETTASLLQWTGNAIDLVELIYGIDVMGCINNGNMPLKPVSYTHLDVYKRQRLFRSKYHPTLTGPQ